LVDLGRRAIQQRLHPFAWSIAIGAFAFAGVWGNFSPPPICLREDREKRAAAT